jgi:RNA polymerase sigma-70 factor (ECF subfamily)
MGCRARFPIAFRPVRWVERRTEMKALCEFAECCGANNPGNRDAQLLKNIQAPGRLAFREIVEAYQNRVFSVSYALLGDAQEADEAAQKVFAAIYRTHYIDRERNEIRWVYRLTVKQCLGVLRTRRRHKFFAWLTGRSSDSTVAELPAAPGRGQKVLLLRAFSMVSDKERALLVLSEVANQSVEDIAEIMHMESPAVRRRLFVARKRLLASAAEG